MRDPRDERPRSTLLPSVVDDVSIGTPNCPDCLMRMEVAESSSGEPYWSCAHCGLVRLA